MSARPGPCGGHRATGVPTAINSCLFVNLSKAVSCRDCSELRTAHPAIRPQVTLHCALNHCTLPDLPDKM